MDSKNTFVFDARGTTIPAEAISGLQKAFFDHGDRFSQELTHLRQLSKKDVNSPEFREYLEQAAPSMCRLLRNNIYTVSFYPDVKPTLESIKARGDYSRILSKGAQEVLIEMYRQAGLDLLIRGFNSTTTDIIPNKTNPICYIALEKEIMEPYGEVFTAYTSDDPKETNACREAFKNTDVDVFFIDRGQGGKEKLAEKVKVIKNLQEVLG